jgi:rSAM/selenodomain-associated transferase 2
MLSIIVPALNEAANLERLLPALLGMSPALEVVVADGGSLDATLEVVRRLPRVKLIAAPRGRARQMNAGARVATGETLLFLHADTALPAGAPEAVAAALRAPEVVGGRFDVRFDSPRPIFGLIAAMMNLRSRASGIATGDQAIFVRRCTFESLGGYPDIPLMEDVEFSRRLKRQGRLAYLDLRVTTSARKWRQEGVAHTILLMWALRFLYFVGVRPARLHRWYYGMTTEATRPDRPAAG